MLPEVRAEGKGDSVRNGLKEAGVQKCEPTDRNRIERLSSQGELARHNKTVGLRGQGKCGGCARKVHVLIRGGLFALASGGNGERDHQGA